MLGRRRAPGHVVGRRRAGVRRQRRRAAARARRARRRSRDACSTDDPSGNATGPPAASSPSPSGLGATSALSFDGQLLALAAHGEVRVIRRSDGALVTRIPDGLTAEYEPVRVTLSPLARFVVTQSQGAPSVSSVFRMSDGTRAGAFAVDSYGWNWVGVAFSQREDRVYSDGYRSGADRSDAIDLGAGTSSFAPIANFTVVIGSSIGCPVLYESTRGAWRSCGACEDAPVGGGEQYNPFRAQGGVLSSDGKYVGDVVDAHRSGREAVEDAARAGRVAAPDAARAAGTGGNRSSSRSPFRGGARRALTGAAAGRLLLLRTAVSDRRCTTSRSEHRRRHAASGARRHRRHDARRSRTAPQLWCAR